MTFNHVDTAAGSDAEHDPAFYDEPLGVQELARMQSVSAMDDTGRLLADFWPESDSVEEFAAAVRQWRDEGA